jgi:hypothetical protein
MSTFIYTNNASSNLAAPISSGATSVTLSSGTGALFPNPSAGQQFSLTFNDAATGLLTEIAYCTARSGDVLTIVRAQEGTTAQAWAAGDLAANFVTAAAMNAFLQSQTPSLPPVSTTGTNHTFSGSDVGNLVRRSNSGSAMFDTLPGTSPGQLFSGQVIHVRNDDASAILAVSAGSGANLNGVASGFLLIGPGQEIGFDSDGTNYWTLEAPLRCRLGAATTFFISTTGSDSTFGTTVGTAWATKQHAWDYCQKNFDLNGFAITFQCAAGSYTDSVYCSGPMVGQNNQIGGAGTTAPSVIFRGDPTTPTNVQVANANYALFLSLAGAAVHVTGFYLLSTGGICLTAGDGGLMVFDAINFGASPAGTHIASLNWAFMVCSTASYTVSGGAATHCSASGNAFLAINTATVTVSGTPAFSASFAQAGDNGTLQSLASTFSGSATGVRYSVSLNGVIDTGGGGANFFPGNSAGTTSTGGQYH